MTAFARVEGSGAWGSATWEVRSVNNRFLDMGVRLPEELRSLEPAVREMGTARLARGKVDCSLRLTGTAAQGAAIKVNTDAAAALLAAAHEIAALAPDAALPGTIDILRWPGVVEATPPDLETTGEAVLGLLSRALDELIDNRGREGARIAAMLGARLDEITCIVAGLRGRLPGLLTAARERLAARLHELREQLDAERLEQEIAIVAQKTDVAEELDRLDAHVAEVREQLAQDKPVGRRLDFLMQELNREANTLGSKAVDNEVTRASVNLKVLIEQMREQVQNVE